MANPIRIAAAVPDTRPADGKHNAESVLSLLAQARTAGADLAVFPALCLTGCGLGDLYGTETLLAAAQEGLSRVLDALAGGSLTAVVGLPIRKDGQVVSAAAVADGTGLLGVEPLTGEPPFVHPAVLRPGSVTLAGREVPFAAGGVYPAGSATVGVGRGGAVTALPRSDGGFLGADARRERECLALSGIMGNVYVSVCPGPGETTTDAVYGGHVFLCRRGEPLARSLFASGLTIVNSEDPAAELPPAPEGPGKGKTPLLPEDEAARDAVCRRVLTLQALALRRRTEHVGAKKLLLAVSGGLDSTLALLVCREALGMMGRPLSDLVCITMPGFGTTGRTRSNAEGMSRAIGAEFMEIPLEKTLLSHFADFGHDRENRNAAYENAQARLRTATVMDLANDLDGLMVGTGDLSELALGWCTYGGDQMSMYAVNGGVPKTMVRAIVENEARRAAGTKLGDCLRDVAETPVSPELLPGKAGQILQKTEDIVGPYRLHDHFLYSFLTLGLRPREILERAAADFAGEYDRETVKKWLTVLFRRLFSQQFKRSCMPDGPRVLPMSLSPRGGWAMPSDASAALYLAELEEDHG